MTQDLSLIEGRRTIAVNMAYLLAPWADILLYGDCPWVTTRRYWPPAARDMFKGQLVHCCPHKISEAPEYVRVLKKRKVVGLCDDPSELAHNRSTGAAAINLAAHLGVRRIVLIGYDMRREPGRTNFHDRYDHDKDYNPYPRFNRVFPSVKNHLDRLGISVINATPGSAITAWPVATLEEALSGAD